jgi:hypothetical protein
VKTRLKTKKPRGSFAARRFPVYNLMKSLQIWWSLISSPQRSSPQRSSPQLPLSISDDTKVQHIGPAAKDKKVRLLKVF